MRRGGELPQRERQEGPADRAGELQHARTPLLRAGAPGRGRPRRAADADLQVALRRRAARHRGGRPARGAHATSTGRERAAARGAAAVGAGSIPLDTGEVERQIRRVAMGRATWVFSGSDAGATRMMLAASLCATCRKLGIDPWQYLRAVFTAIANRLTARQLADHWTPWAWAQKQAQQPNAQETLAVAS
ncbi:MAG: transposase [Deltaproteobacteria bacterium]|nr:transposase [Deltaproteobacteria bacterium]